MEELIDKQSSIDYETGKVIGGDDVVKKEKDVEEGGDKEEDETTKSKAVCPVLYVRAMIPWVLYGVCRLPSRPGRLQKPKSSDSPLGLAVEVLVVSQDGILRLPHRLQHAAATSGTMN